MSQLVVSEVEQLLHEARGGDGGALDRLLELCRSHLKVLAQRQIGRHLRSKVDASDVVQETLLRAWHDFPQFRGATEKELLGWLRQVLACLLANLVRHYVGTQRRDVRLERRITAKPEQRAPGLDYDLADPQSSPSHEAIRGERAVLLAEALARLPDEWRVLLTLHHLQGLSFPEVAQRMGRTVDSVKKTWPRALATLRRLLEGHL